MSDTDFNEDLTEHVNEPEPVVETVPAPESEASESSPPVAETSQEPAEDDYLALDDVTRVTRAQAAEIAQLYRALETDPRQVAAIFAQQFLADQYDLVPRQQGQAPPPPSLDDDTLFSPEKLQAFIAHQVAQGVEQQIAPMRAELTHRQVAESHAFAKVGAEKFAAHHGLSPEQVDMIAAEAARKGVLNSTYNAADPVQSIFQALDDTYWTIPAFREHEEKFRADQAKETAKRQRKLSMVGGTSGSVPRTQPRPQTSQERTQAMADELAAHMGIHYSQES